MYKEVDVKKIKDKALKRLKGNYLQVILAFIIYGALLVISSGVAQMIREPAMQIFLNLIVTSLLYMGLIQVTVKISRKKKTSFEELFTRTDLFFKSAGITIVLIAVNTLFALLEYTAVGSLVVFLTHKLDINLILSSFMIVIGILLSVAIIIFWIVLTLYFSQCYFVLYDDNNLQLLDIFRKSMDIMEGHKTDYLIMILSFVGWMILGLFTFGILYIWLIPYMYVTKANFYDLVKEDARLMED